MLPFVKKLVKKEDNSSTSVTSSKPPFTFDDDSDNAFPYSYPNLFEEAEEMLQVSMLIYSITDLRAIAKHPKKSQKLAEPQRILDLPLNLAKCLELLEENADVVREEFGDDEHANTMSSLQHIHERYQRHQESGDGDDDDSKDIEHSTETQKSPTKNYVSHWFRPLFSHGENDGNIEVQTTPMVPMLTAYGDENPETDMVYAVGIDHIRRRVTVAFRGSVTPTDFARDASIHMKHLPNPVPDSGDENVGIHQGFFDYLLKKRKNTSKLDEIIGHVKALFLEEPYRQQQYKMYVTGHSLGGALATIFSFYVASSVLSGEEQVIPSPVSCISIASPRCGDQNFQKAFAQLEAKSYLRHLRIANSGDPITLLPGATGKKIWARLSPVSYLAFKLMDNEFEKKETFRHTGLKLRLAKGECDFAYVGEHLDVFEEEENHDGASSERSIKSKKGNLRRPEKIPDPNYHLGKAYTESVASVKEQLSGLTLNDLYRTKVAALVAKEGLEEEGEQS